MNISRKLNNATNVWMTQCGQILAYGNVVKPRGQQTLELVGTTIYVNMVYPLVVSPARKLSMSFAAAEALWIISGDNRVDSIAQYNKNIAKFSDDGVIFSGAYGPRIQMQFDYAVEKLLEDRETRQSVITIWTPNPPPSMDIPCTVAMVFSIRDDMLNSHVFMRSSDVWLGLPYDIFNFTMVAARIACEYNNRSHETLPVQLGELTLTMASSHAYQRDFERINECIMENSRVACNPVPQSCIATGNWHAIESSLIACRDNTLDQNEQVWKIRS